MVIARTDTPKYGETLKSVYIKYQSILVKSYQRFTKFNYGVTRRIMKANYFEPALRPNHYLLIPVYMSRSVSPYFGITILAITVLLFLSK